MKKINKIAVQFNPSFCNNIKQTKLSYKKKHQIKKRKARKAFKEHWNITTSSCSAKTSTKALGGLSFWALCSQSLYHHSHSAVHNFKLHVQLNLTVWMEFNKESKSFETKKSKKQNNQNNHSTHLFFIASFKGTEKSKSKVPVSFT